MWEDVAHYRHHHSLCRGSWTEHNYAEHQVSVQHACIHFFLLLSAHDYRCDMTSHVKFLLFCFLSTMDCNLKLGAKVNPFSSKLISVGLFSHSYKAGRQARCYTPLIPSTERERQVLHTINAISREGERQVDLWSWGQSGLYSKFLVGHGYVEKSCFEQTGKREEKKRKEPRTPTQSF